MPPDDWTRPHLERSALLLIDVQADFLDGGLSPVAGTSDVVPALVRLAAAFREAGRPVFHMLRLYAGEDVDLVRREAVSRGAGPVVPGTPGARIPAELVGSAIEPDPVTLLSGELQPVGPVEWLLWKPRWSAFHRTPLEHRLRVLGVDTVVVAGCNFPNCPRATIFDASERDFRVVMVTDATSGVTDERRSDLVGIGAVAMRTAALVEWLGSRLGEANLTETVP